LLISIVLLGTPSFCYSSTMEMSNQDFAAALTDWYITSHRSLPWRNTRDPYAVWVSEVMLQQTQVRTVIDYYQRFLQRYPSIEVLAAAPIDDVLKLWEGLGYYARGRNLHAAAQQIVKHHGGCFPLSIEAVEALPGIGRSTAGAILTFGAAQRHPLLDGNVKRVLSRVANIADPVEQPQTLRTLWSLSEKLLSGAEDPYSYNQAIMELGATLCLPKEPRCLLCPIQNFCTAYSAGTQNERPVKGPKKPPNPHLMIAVGVVWKGDEILIQQRPTEGLLGGLWEFPGGKQESGESLEETVRREMQEELAITVTVGPKIAKVKHAYSHFKITLHAYHCRYESGDPTPADGQLWHWVPPEGILDYAFPKANKTVLTLILEEWTRHRQPPDFSTVAATQTASLL
jgi:A/G-specific adenine glycosylase